MCSSYRQSAYRMYTFRDRIIVSFSGTSVKAWRRENSPKPVKIWLLLSTTTKRWQPTLQIRMTTTTSIRALGSAGYENFKVQGPIAYFTDTFIKIYLINDDQLGY